MTKEQIIEALHREVHFTWKHAFWVMGGAVAAFIALASSTAVNTSRIDDHQKTLDVRAPSVMKLERLDEKVDALKDSLDDLKLEQRAATRRLEDKLDRALEK